MGYLNSPAVARVNQAALRSDSELPFVSTADAKFLASFMRRGRRGSFLSQLFVEVLSFRELVFQDDDAASGL